MELLYQLSYNGNVVFFIACSEYLNIKKSATYKRHWIPAFAGMTKIAKFASLTKRFQSFFRDQYRINLKKRERKA